MLGIHIAKSSHILDDKNPDELHEAIHRDLDPLGLNACQIFCFGPQNMRVNKMNYEKVKEATKDISLFVHSSYLSTGIWKVKKENKHTEHSKKLINMIEAQLEVCDKIDAAGLVIHINRIFPDEVADTMNCIKRAVTKYKAKIILEPPSYKSDADRTYDTPEKIDNLIKQIGITEPWYGICVDTAHLWGAGENVSSYEYMSGWLDRLINKKKILLFHLNGSSSKLASGSDKHEIAFSERDKIWYNVESKKSGLYAVLEFAKRRGVPIICEINRGTEKDAFESLELIKKLLIEI